MLLPRPLSPTSLTNPLRNCPRSRRCPPRKQETRYTNPYPQSNFLHLLPLLPTSPLTRNQDPEDAETIPGVSWFKAEYGNKNQIASLLGGVDVLLSFIDAVTDAGGENQKSLIDGAILAGVKRFAPSEWSTWVIPSWKELRGVWLMMRFL